MFFLMKDVRLVIFVILKTFFPDEKIPCGRCFFPDERCTPGDICTSEDMYS